MNIDNNLEALLPAESPQTEESGGKEGATRNLKKEEIGPVMVIWSREANRQRLMHMRAAFKKAMKGKWNGILLHLLPGETIGSLKLMQAQALYESLLRMFDPDLFELRIQKRAAAEAAKKKEEETQLGLTANQVADRLEAIQRENREAQIASVSEATARLEDAATQKIA